MRTAAEMPKGKGGGKPAGKKTKGGAGKANLRVASYPSSSILLC